MKLDGFGHKHFSGTREITDALRDAHGQSDHIVEPDDEEQVTVTGQLHNLRVGDAFSHIPTRAGLNKAVPASMQHQGRDRHRGKQPTHIQEPIGADEIRSHAKTFTSRQPRTERLVSRSARRHDLHRRARAPQFPRQGAETLEGPRRETPGVVVVPNVAGVRVDKDEPAHPLRTLNRIPHRGRTATAETDQHHPLTPDRVQDCGQITAQDVVIPEILDIAARSADPPQLSPHRPGETTETPRETDETRVFPQDIYRNRQPRREHNIKRTVTSHLIRNTHAVRPPRIPRHRRLVHTTPFPTAQSDATRLRNALAAGLRRRSWPGWRTKRPTCHQETGPPPRDLFRPRGEDPAADVCAAMPSEPAI